MQQRPIRLGPLKKRKLPPLNSIKTFETTARLGSVTLAVEWLSPRIKQFRKLHPDIQLELLTSYYLSDLSGEDIDLAIRYGPGNYKDVVSEKLMEEMIGPACHPDLVQDNQDLSILS